MTTGAAEDTFVDTNVVVYASVAESPFHAQAVAAIERCREGSSEVWVSRQVLREFLATLSRPQVFGGPIAPHVLASQIRFLERRFRVAESTFG